MVQFVLSRPLHALNIIHMEMTIRTSRRIARALIAVVILTLISGCHSRQPDSAGPGTDDHGKPRIVSTVPAATEILLQLHAGSSLAAVSTYDKPLLPASLKNLPVIGNYLRLNTELMLKLDPKSLILQINPALIPAGVRELCQQVHCRMIDIKLNSAHELENTVLRLGQAANCPGRARRAVAHLRRAFQSLELSRRNMPPVRVVYFLSAQPLMVVGGGNFMDDEIHLAGGINLGRTFGSGFPKITHVELQQLKPQKVLVWHPDAVAHHAYRWLVRHYGPKLYRIRWPDADLLTLNVITQINQLSRIIHQPISLPVNSATGVHPERRP
ncbi:MAG: ABC transporter substrate-binding protein [Phycisphaerae bacterium]